MIIGGGIEEWTNEMIHDVFFLNQNVWQKLNRLIINMQMYVLKSPDFAEYVEQKEFQKARNGDKVARDFCMVNPLFCRLEMKAFYLIKSLEGDSRYFKEDLLNFDDFSVYLPLF